MARIPGRGQGSGPLTVIDRIDPVRVGEELLYNVFHHVFHNDDARAHLGFSLINFFSNAEGAPGWNLWLCDDSGAHQLSLMAADVTPDGDPDKTGKSFPELVVAGRFAIRYFPAVDDPLLAQYSRVESRLRLGPLFDQTGTPTLDGQARIDESAFVVGYVDFRTDSGRNFLELACVAPNRWKEVRINGLGSEKKDPPAAGPVDPGKIDRYVPGWDLAFGLFHKLIACVCYAFKTAPCAAVTGEKKWVRFHIDTDNACGPVEDREIDLFRLVVGLELHSDGPVSINPEAYRHGVRNDLAAEGFKHLCETRHPENPTEGKACAEWWTVKDLVFSHDHQTEQHLCCYHDH